MSQKQSKPVDIPKKDASGTKKPSGGTGGTGGASKGAGGSGKSDKKNSTSSNDQKFMIVSADGNSPPKYVSLEEIMAAASGLQDMALVHQIAVDKDFKLVPVHYEENSPEKKIKDNMHKAFWDMLKEELNAKPPKYDQALNLLGEIKERLHNLLLPQHTKLKQEIDEKLDIDHIKQQAEKGALNFQQYAQYVVSTMGKLCAPIRDDQIKELQKKKDAIDIFKGVFELLDLMSLDMANFTLDLAKPDIIAHSVEYERKKFADVLKVQDDGLKNTKAWLLNRLDKNKKPTKKDDYNAFIRELTKATYTEACIDLLDRKKGAPFPETFMLDEVRLYDLMMRTKRCIYIGTALLITFSNVGQDLQQLQKFKENLKTHLAAIVEPADMDEDLEKLIPNIADQVVKEIKDNKKEVPKNMKELILEMKNPDHKIRSLVHKRIHEFYTTVIKKGQANVQEALPGLNLLYKELVEIAQHVLRLVAHNSAVFCEYYFDIVAKVVPKA